MLPILWLRENFGSWFCQTPERAFTTVSQKFNWEIVFLEVWCDRLFPGCLIGSVDPGDCLWPIRWRQRWGPLKQRKCDTTSNSKEMLCICTHAQSKPKRLWLASWGVMLPLCSIDADNSAQSKDELGRLPREASNQSCKQKRRLARWFYSVRLSRSARVRFMNGAMLRANLVTAKESCRVLVKQAQRISTLLPKLSSPRWRRTSFTENDLRQERRLLPKSLNTLRCSTIEHECIHRLAIRVQWCSRVMLLNSVRENTIRSFDRYRTKLKRGSILQGLFWKTEWEFSSRLSWFLKIPFSFMLL